MVNGVSLRHLQDPQTTVGGQGLAVVSADHLRLGRSCGEHEAELATQPPCEVMRYSLSVAMVLDSNSRVSPSISFDSKSTERGL